MTDSIRCGVITVVTGVALLCAAAAAQAQPKRVPSTLLPLEPLWSTSLPGTPAAAPVYEGGRIFVAVRDGSISAVNLADGSVVWQVALQVAGQPAAGGGLLYVASRDELHGFDTTTGESRWSIPLEAPLSAPLVWNVGGWLIAALETQTLLALRPENGETIWRQTMSGGISVGPSLAADRMYVSLDSGGVVALALMTGNTVWEKRLEGTPNQILPLDDLFVGATDNNFYRLSLLDGSIRWVWRTGGDVVGLPAVDEKRVYFSSRDNMLWALDRKSGVQQWRRPLSARPTGGPSHAGDLLVLGGTSNYLSFFNPVTGVPYARIPASSELAFPPLSLATATDGPVLITVTGDGQLRALGHATGPKQILLAAAIPAETDEALDFVVPALPTEDGANVSQVAAVDDAAAAKEVAVVEAATAVAEVTAVEEATAVEEVAAVEEATDVAAADAVADATNVADAASSTTTAITSAPEEIEPVELPVVRPSVGGEYAIQVGAFSNGANATGLVDRLIEQGYPAYVFMPRPGDEPAIHRVRIGDYPDRSAASEIGRQVEDEAELDWFVVSLP